MVFVPNVTMNHHCPIIPTGLPDRHIAVEITFDWLVKPNTYSLVVKPMNSIF